MHNANKAARCKRCKSATCPAHVARQRRAEFVGTAHQVEADAAYFRSMEQIRDSRAFRANPCLGA